MFKENDYIVQLHESKSTYLLKNHIYQQNTNSDQLRTNKDSTNRKCNSSYVFYDYSERWRYGTPEEIEEYNRRGEPYDVTTLKPKFLIGKWYKNYEPNYHYMKCSSYTKDYLYGSEYIDEVKFKSQNQNQCQYSWDINGPILADLSEIQQYLPEGHPDKIEKSIPEYFECIYSDNSYSIIGRIYKYKCISEPHYGLECNLKCGIYEPGNILYFDMSNLIPSTKEAYEKQNKSEIPMNTYGLKVGDKLPESVIRKWAFIGKNYYTGTWKSNSSVFSGDRKILSFKMLDDIVGFEVSQTADVYLRAEGFKEFMKNGLNVKEKISINTNEFQIGDELEAIGNWNGFNAKPGSKAIVVSNRTDDITNFFSQTNRIAVDIKWIEIVDSKGKNLSLNKQSNGLYDRENFKKIEFKLPEKWYVKATKENEEVLKQWRGGSYTGWKDDLCVSYDKYWESVSYCSKQGFAEITYEQFQKYVLKKDEILTEGNKISLFYKEYPLTPKETFESNELIIPQLKKEKIKINFDLSTSKAVDIQINLSKKQTKQVKQIKIEKFNLSL